MYQRSSVGATQHDVLIVLISALVSEKGSDILNPLNSVKMGEKKLQNSFRIAEVMKDTFTRCCLHGEHPVGEHLLLLQFSHHALHVIS